MHIYLLVLLLKNKSGITDPKSFGLLNNPPPPVPGMEHLLKNCWLENLQNPQTVDTFSFPLGYIPERVDKILLLKIQHTLVAREREIKLEKSWVLALHWVAFIV